MSLHAQKKQSKTISKYLNVFKSLCKFLLFSSEDAKTLKLTEKTIHRAILVCDEFATNLRGGISARQADLRSQIRGKFS